MVLCGENKLILTKEHHFGGVLFLLFAAGNLLTLVDVCVIIMIVIIYVLILYFVIFSSIFFRKILLFFYINFIQHTDKFINHELRVYRCFFYFQQKYIFTSVFLYIFSILMNTCKLLYAHQVFSRRATTGGSNYGKNKIKSDKATVNRQVH